MSETNLNERIVRLEKQVIRITRIAWLMGAVLLLVVTLGAVKSQLVVPDSIRTKELRIVDDTGKTREILGMMENNPQFALADKDGKTRIALSLINEAQSFMMFDKDGNPRFSINIFGNEPSLELYDKTGNRLIVIGTSNTENHEALVALCDKDGNPRVGMSIDEGVESLRLVNRDGKITFEAP